MRIPIIGLLVAFAALTGLPALSSSTPVTRIALVADTHTTSGTKGDEPRYAERLAQTIAAVNAANVDIVLIAGDLTDNAKPEQIADFQTAIKAFTAPVYCIPGNHDVGPKIVPGKPGGVTQKRVLAYEAIFGPSFWSIEKAGVKIIGLNSSLLGSGLPREDDQWSFLQAQLAHPAGIPTLVVMHYPLYLVSPDEPGGIYWNVEPAPRQRLMALLKQGGVCAVLTGHLHRPLVNHWEGISLITSVPVSFGLPRGEQPEGWTLVTVTGDGTVNSTTETIPG